jgi:hypothetical protein
MEYFIGWIVLSIIVAFIGSSKTIGFFFSLLLSLLFSPIIGLIIVALSKSKQTDLLEKELLKMKHGADYKTDAEIFKKHREAERLDLNETIAISPIDYFSKDMIRMYVAIIVCAIIAATLFYINR